MHSNRYPNKYTNQTTHIQQIPMQQPPTLIPTSYTYQYQYQPPINPAISHAHISYPGSSLPTTSKQFLHYNNLINQNHQLYNDNQILLIKLQKYQKLEPYINTLISKNSQLQQIIQSLKSQNTYLTKNIKQLHVQSRNNQHTHNNKIKQLQNTIQIGKDNGIKIRLQNENLNNKIKIYINQIQEYKKKMQQILTQKILQQQTIKQIASQKDKLLGQVKQLQIYNKQLVRNNNIKQQQYLQKISNKQQTIKILQININQLHIQINKIKQELCIKNQQVKQMEYDFGILSKNHENVLKDFRSVSLKKVQIQELLEQSLRKIEIRQNQLRQLQMFRQQQRLSFNNQLNKLQHAYSQQKYQYEQAIQHKSLKNQKLTQNYNQFLQKHQHLQTDLWELQHSLQQQYKQNKQKIYQIQLRQQHIEKLIIQLQSYKQKQHTILQRLHCVQQQKQSLYNGLDLIQKKYTERQKQFDQFVQNMRFKFQDQKNKWDKLYQQQKVKLKMTHEYEKKQIQTSLNKKILILEGDIESYRCRLSRAEQDAIQKTHKQINQTRNIIQLNSKLSHLHLDRTFQRKSVQKKDSNRFSQQFQINSGSKTARPTLK